MTDAELSRTARARARRARSTTVVFQKICRGLYISHEHGMTLSHDAVWSRSAGRKWVLRYQLSYRAMFAPSTYTKTFDTIAAARAYANALVQPSSPTVMEAA